MKSCIQVGQRKRNRGGVGVCLVIFVQISFFAGVRRSTLREIMRRTSLSYGGLPFRRPEGCWLLEPDYGRPGRTTTMDGQMTTTTDDGR